MSLPSHPLTDSGNAELLRDMFGHELRYCAPERKFYWYDGIIWRPDNRHFAEACTKEVARALFRAAAKDCQDAAEEVKDVA